MEVQNHPTPFDLSKFPQTSAENVSLVQGDNYAGTGRVPTIPLSVHKILPAALFGCAKKYFMRSE